MAGVRRALRTVVPTPDEPGPEGTGPDGTGGTPAAPDRTARPGLLRRRADDVDRDTDRTQVRAALSRFLVAGLVSLAVVSVPSALLMRHLARAHTLAELEAGTVLMAENLVAPLVDEAVLAGDPEALALLDRTVAGRTADGSVVRISVWERSGRVVYSDAPGLTGLVFPGHDWDETVLVEERPVASFEDDGEPLNGYEPPEGHYVEVDTVFDAASGDSLVFEAYYPAAVVHDAQRDMLLKLLPVGLGTLLVLQLAQLPQAARLAGRIQRLEVGRRRLLRQAAAASDLERRRLARDLHDDVLQNLAGVSYALESVVGRSGDAQPVVDRSRDVVRTSVAQLRAILAEVYPTNLEDQDLVGALTELADRVRAAGVDVLLDLSSRPVDPTTATLLFRVARESLTNVLKHAGARRVSVELRAGPGSMTLVVADDGRGFDPGGDARHGHLGLVLVRDAVAEAGGSVDVLSAPGAGTTVSATVPLV